MPQITVMLETEFVDYHQPGAPDLYPPAQRREIEALATLIYHAVNNGVYRAGLATTQAAYEEACDTLFATMSALDERLAQRRFLFGGELCEADVRLFPTLARFDAVYYIHFKCNLHRLIDYHNLWGLRPRSLPAPGFRRHHGLRPDQAPLLPDAGPGSTRPGSCPRARSSSWLEPHGRDRVSDVTVRPRRHQADKVLEPRCPGSLVCGNDRQSSFGRGDVRRVF